MARISKNSTFSNATEVHGAGDYFVSAIDGPDYYLLAGPYADHAAAAGDVEKVKTLANKHDSTGKAAFMAYGTCRKDVGSGRIGVLNRHGLI